MAGYAPKLLRVNLSQGTIKEEDIPATLVKDFVGGRGLGIKYLYDELSPGIDPLGAENKLLFSIGPLAGAGALSASRWIVTTKSPLTGTYYRSVGGADFGAWLKFAGLDLIIVEGKAPKPVYLYIEDGHRELMDASRLWGKGTVETQKKLKETHGTRTQVACIGPAGEKLVRYACIISDTRAAGRGGVGTVMGSKNLKAIAINAARKEKPTAKFKELISEQIIAVNYNMLFPVFSEFGTLMITERVNAMGGFPTRNFREGSIKGWQNITSDRYLLIKEKNTACYGCTLHCGNTFTTEEGPYAGTTSDGPDYETVNMFTGSIDSTDIGATVAADALCDDLGMDTISAGNSIGFAYELFERGILTKADTGGLDLTYGNYESALELIKRIANREGLGAILAEGVKRAAERIGKGSKAYAMHIKGLEMVAYDPRAFKTHGLTMLTSNVGANHSMGYCWQELFNLAFPRPVDRFAEKGNADIAKLNQDQYAMFEVGVMCFFPFTMNMAPTLLFCKMLASITGIPEFGAPGYMLRVGERIYNLERAFNLREGFGRKDDVFPKRITTEPLKNAGPAEGQLISNPEGMLDEYYRVRGWDEKGIPTPEKLKALGLGKIIKDIR